MDARYPQRKQVRLITYDYNGTGVYFITICVKGRLPVLSNLVGDGAHDVPQIQLSEIGKIIEKYILSSNRIPGVTVNRYIIMPDHIHMIVSIHPAQNETSALLSGDGMSRAPSPTNDVVPHLVSTFKRFCNKEIGSNIFQRSYYEHIIRNRDEYDAIVRYIYENPLRWNGVNHRNMIP